MATFDTEVSGTVDMTDTSVGRFVTFETEVAASLAREQYFLAAYDTNGAWYYWPSNTRSFAQAPTPDGGASYASGLFLHGQIRD